MGGALSEPLCPHAAGQTANAWCPIRRHEWIAAEAPSVPCSWHHRSEQGLLTFWPAEFRQWARDRGLDAGARLDDRAPVAASGRAEWTVAPAAPAAQGLAIVSPPDGATYLIDPTLRREFQTLSLRAQSSTGRPLEWRVSGQVVGTVAADGQVEWPLAPGTHRIEVRDGGRSSEATVVVR
jgi:hypothetical protein